MKEKTQDRLIVFVLFPIAIMTFLYTIRTDVPSAKSLHEQYMTERTEVSKRVCAEIGDVYCASYSPNPPSFEVWFSGTHDTTIIAKTFIPTDSAHHKDLHDSIFGCNIIVVRDTGDRWTFGGFVKK